MGVLPPRARREWIDIIPREVPEPRMFVLGAAIIFGFAPAFQMIAWLSRSLYDVTAGLCYGAYGEKLGCPIEPMPP